MSINICIYIDVSIFKDDIFHDIVTNTWRNLLFFNRL